MTAAASRPYRRPDSWLTDYDLPRKPSNPLVSAWEGFCATVEMVGAVVFWSLALLAGVATIAMLALTLMPIIIIVGIFIALWLVAAAFAERV